MRRWAAELAATSSNVVRIGYFGSYARGNSGVGSDIDLVVIVESSDRPQGRRVSEWDTTMLPVPADLLVYTADEWNMLKQRGRFLKSVDREAVWVFSRAEVQDGI